MPRLFGMHEHFEEEESREKTKRFEAVEIHAMADYLLFASQPVAPLGSPAQITEPPSIDRGKRLFLTQGCLACHKHRDFPQGVSTQGPDLSRIGAKLRSPVGAPWLASWIRNPLRHSPRTLMPNPQLQPTPLADGKSGKPRMTDPAADIAAYLLGCKGWSPDFGRSEKEQPPEGATPTADERLPPAPRRQTSEADIDELALDFLKKTYSNEQAEQF